ncbi:MAG: hypothetical protein JJ975_10085 [Bacteroidia bacterium]|nr:hypothetical protein [Bacteroidia bacterium]
MNISTTYLRSRGLWFGLLVLLLNDHYLKLNFPGPITGKLSDVVGLFVFPIFLSVFRPRRIIQNCIAAGIIFCLWKSHLSEPIITAGNSIGIPFTRTIDQTDYAALMVLPASTYYLKRWRLPRLLPRIRLTHLVFLAIGFVALSATTLRPVFGTSLDKKYNINATPEQLVRDIRQMDCQLHLISSNAEGSHYELRNLVIDGKDSMFRLVRFSLKENKSGTSVHVKDITTYEGYASFFDSGRRRWAKKLVKTYFIEEIAN